MRAVLICGKFSTGLHGRIDVERLYEERAITGSESSFFNVARGLAERGHGVVVYCDAVRPVASCARLGGAEVRHIDDELPVDADAYISLNEPDQFRRLPAGVRGLRVVQQQLNDFHPCYCQPGFERWADICAFLSPAHRSHLLRITPQIDPAHATWIPNSIDLAMSNEWIGQARRPNSAIWCSSPDRGLHVLLDVWPAVRKAAPDATLDIYYRFMPWFDSVREERSASGDRARAIGKSLETLGQGGESGVYLHGARPNRMLAQALVQTDVLPYTCEPISFTEGFSVSIMDACASGARPIISDADAIGDIYKSAVTVVPGAPSASKTLWADLIVRSFRSSAADKAAERTRQRAFAERFDRHRVAVLWERLIEQNRGRKHDFRYDSLPTTISEFVDASLVDPSMTTPSITSSPSRPKVTVLLGSNRPGGIDVAFAGLAQQTFKDFEVVFVDGRYHRRHARVLEAAKTFGLQQPLYHVPNHRFSGHTWGTACAGFNTGFALAAGEIVVMLLDYAYAPPTWLEEHVRHQETGSKLIMAPHEYRVLQNVLAIGTAPVLDFMRMVREEKTWPPNDSIRRMLAQGERFDEVSAFAQPFAPSMLDSFPLEDWQEVKVRLNTGPLDDTNAFNTKNESFPTAIAFDINGMDENYDRGSGPGDPDMGLRLKRAGLATWTVREAIVHCLNPRKILPNPNLVLPHTGRLPRPHEERWNSEDGMRHFDKTLRENRTMARNPVELSELRRRLKDWREMSLKPEACIPMNIVPDHIYFAESA